MWSHEWLVLVLTTAAHAEDNGEQKRANGY